MFPMPRSWVERFYNIDRWTDLPAGGHFPNGSNQTQSPQTFAPSYALYAEKVAELAIILS